MNDAQSLAAASTALHWVWAAQLQIERFGNAFALYAQDPNPATPATVGAQRLRSNTFAEAQFLLNAAGQAEKALEPLDGIALGSEGEKIRTLRNIHEHWEQHRESFASKTRPKHRAGAEFAANYPDNVPWSFRIDATGTWISNLRLNGLWEELVICEDHLLAARSDASEALGIDKRLGIVRPPVGSVIRAMPAPPMGKVLGFAALTQNIVLGEGQSTPTSEPQIEE